MIHLDTNYLIAALKNGTSEQKNLRSWLANGSPLAMNTIVWAELLSYPLSVNEAELLDEFIPKILPFQMNDAFSAAQLFNKTGRRPKSFTDCMIAASAIRRKAPLATSNLQDFQPFLVHGLKLA